MGHHWGGSEDTTGEHFLMYNVSKTFSTADRVRASVVAFRKYDPDATGGIDQNDLRRAFADLGWLTPSRPIREIHAQFIMHEEF